MAILRSVPQLQALQERFIALPYLTFLTLSTIIGVYFISVIFPSVTLFFALDVNAVLHGGIHRLITYPIVHQNFLHLFFNVIALAPVLSSFEEETGTIGTAASLLVFSVLPGIAYVAVSTIVSSHVITLGASGWVFTFMAYFALKDYALRQSIYLSPSLHIPTWTTPIITLFVIALLLPGSSFLGHLFGLLTGYAYGLGYLNNIKASQQVILRAESNLSSRNLNKLLPRFISDDSASKHRVIIDTTVDAGVPSGGNSPALSPTISRTNSEVHGGRSSFAGQGHSLGS
ncbi:hypothetical protein V1514DRAFT_334309 [Lipomyces japonicus]|uniref:uncharacterized protein n=1 Tax=Lipomyces japonicus TaxID=56871 RepID=UPI0034CDD8DD